MKNTRRRKQRQWLLQPKGAPVVRSGVGLIVRKDTVTVFGDVSYADEICAVLCRRVVGQFLDDHETYHLHIDDGTECPPLVLRHAEDDGARVTVNGPWGYGVSF